MPKNNEYLRSKEEKEAYAQLEAIDEDEKGSSPSRATAQDREYAAFVNSPFPVLVIDPSFHIVFANEACDRLFARYYHLRKRNFSELFSQALGETALRDIEKSIRAPINGYSWKGIIHNKAREAGTTITKAYLFPLFSPSDQGEAPKRFVVLFDDITEENKTLLRSVFLSLLEASKLKDNDTGKHIQRVNLYSRRLAEELYDRPGYESVDRDFIDDISFLAAMHDVGKIGTPDDILNKKGKLDEWELAVMREHTINGAYILSTYPNPMAREIALYHHERWDGQGYPYKIERAMIPLSARIVAIADVYDALRMPRSYKTAFSHVRAAAYISDVAGKNFDPALVELFDYIQADFRSIYKTHAD